MLRRTVKQGVVRSADETVGGTHAVINEPVMIRVSPHSYFIALLLGSFFSAFLFYLELDLPAVSLFIIAWIVVPFLAMNDHLVFDGRCLTRAGILPSLWSRLNGTRRRLKINDIEQVETQAIRTMKRGGNVYYRYRTAIRGRGLVFAFASGGDEYRQLIGALLPPLSPNTLDNRSLDLRDHLTDPKEALMKAEFEHIPSSEFLRSELGKTSPVPRPVPASNDIDRERAEYLAGLGNELRISGFLPQAAEAFRRALVIDPGNGGILFGFARCLASLAGTERNAKLRRRAVAAFRLALRDPRITAETLARIGESLFQADEPALAEKTFRRVQDEMGGNFRAARGLAEIALRDNKLAYVIHHFSTANRISETPAARRWTRGEVEYFSNLNNDGEYLDMEIGRVEMLESLDGLKRSSLRIALFGFPVIICGLLIDDSLIANIGWSISAIALLIWTGMNMGAKLLAARIPYDIVESDERS